MNLISRFLAVAVLLAVGSAQPAAADPIIITGGSMLVTGPFESGSIFLTGTRGFSLRALVDPNEGEVAAINRCGSEAPECSGGSTISVGTNLVGSAFPSGVATLDGVTYNNIDDANSPATVLLRLGGTITLPPLQASPLLVTTPFTIGQSGFLFPSVSDSVEIQGAGGTATLRLTPGREAEGAATPWVVDFIRYDFGDAAPVPEPATLLLVGAGVVGAWRSRRRAER